MSYLMIFLADIVGSFLIGDALHLSWKFGLGLFCIVWTITVILAFIVDLLDKIVARVGSPPIRPATTRPNPSETEER